MGFLRSGPAREVVQDCKYCSCALEMALKIDGWGLAWAKI